MKKWMIFFVIVAALLVGANSYAPQLAEVGLCQALSATLNLHSDDVRVQASPGVKIFLGDIDAITVHANNFQAGDLTFAHFDCNLYGVHFKPLLALADQEVRVTRAESGEMTASIRSEELEKFLVKKVQGLTDPQVSFEDDAVRVQGRVKLGGLVSAQADVRGHFGMKGSKLMFIPSSVTVEGMGMQISTTQMANAEIYDFAGFPLGIQPDSVTMRDGLLTIHGQVSNS
ncbi:LmeA family phospholipid-binding protein [uncultured Megasphaera sp.]|uniref:LmeA family phospholipid-binding protein n=1 Tax=uncultured Megasphaera sp. TaxID=165188 RepID=UPI00261EE4C7|nr:LmeA family phospholipid-binding protein [uncultured Megasphaera sp.]